MEILHFWVNFSLPNIFYIHCFLIQQYILNVPHCNIQIFHSVFCSFAHYFVISFHYKLSSQTTNA